MLYEIQNIYLYLLLSWRWSFKVVKSRLMHRSCFHVQYRPQAFAGPIYSGNHSSNHEGGNSPLFCSRDDDVVVN